MVPTKYILIVLSVTYIKIGLIKIVVNNPKEYIIKLPIFAKDMKHRLPIKPMLNVLCHIILAII